MTSSTTKIHNRLSSADYSPLKWSDYFDKHEVVTLSDGLFHYYTKGTIGPLVVTLHGAGYSALTWCLFAKYITSKIDIRILAIDLRGHGNTVTKNDNDLSIEKVSRDVYDIVCAIYESELPPLILIGHSMGGAVAVEAAPLFPTLVGVCIIDVVEEMALQSLCGMQNVLKNRPSSFESIEHAVQWAFHEEATRNLESSRVSIPGQIKNKQTGKLASEEIETNEAKPILKLPLLKTNTQCLNSINEDGEDDTNENNPSTKEGVVSESHAYIWRIDLSKTELFWNGWFKGLSEKFLRVNAPKILLLANIHGLDTCLTIAQMQGKFQLKVLPRSGHAIHEDQPEMVADVIGTYLVRPKLAVAAKEFVPVPSYS